MSNNSKQIYIGLVVFILGGFAVGAYITTSSLQFISGHKYYFLKYFFLRGKYEMAQRGTFEWYFQNAP